MENVGCKGRICGLGAAKFLLIIGVVLIHCNYIPDVNEAHVPSVAKSTIMFLSQWLAGGCVPAFFIFSGFLFFRYSDSLTASARAERFRGKLKRRIHTLLAPYLLWNLIAAAILPVKVYCFGMPGFGVFTPQGFSLLDFIKGFWILQDNYPYDFALWFLRNLIVCSALAPLLFYMVRSSVLMLVLIGYALLTGDTFFFALYFLIGGWLGCHDPDFRRVADPRVGCASLAICLMAALLLASVHLSQYIINGLEMLRNLTMVSASLYVARLVPTRGRFWELLLSSTFFVYAFHALYCSVTRKGLVAVLGANSTVTALAVYFGSFLLLMGTSVLAFYIMRRLMPRFSEILTGNRM
ncbi:MAG: acyltransferase [Muribaculaceae bacterium]|nr:acyltransferase [Muribaculaceae bacterium]